MVEYREKTMGKSFNDESQLADYTAKVRLSPASDSPKARYGWLWLRLWHQLRVSFRFIPHGVLALDTDGAMRVIPTSHPRRSLQDALSRATTG